MNILLVYPKYPDTFWSYRYALKFISKKASLPPLGLLTVAAMLPEEWEKKLVDLNISDLTDDDLKWADYVFISAVVVQQEFARETIQRCKEAGVKIVVGGPLFTAGYGQFDEVDHFILNEAENTLPLFLRDLKKGRPQRLYTSAERPDLKKTPQPAWELIHMDNYASMSIQYSRGCPFNCEFCDVGVMFGNQQRTKGINQILRELEILYQYGWRGPVFFVDDNFITNRRKLKQEILTSLIRWMNAKRYPFHFYTETSINLADDEELMELMIRAGFMRVFVGIETVNPDSLAECDKNLNKNRDLVASVKKIQEKGLEVQGGFILGFDNDSPNIFDNQINFIQKSGIVSAMVGLLNAPRGTRLYDRLKKEGRLLSDFLGDHTVLSLNFVPKMNSDTLTSGYRKILRTIYSPKKYYERVLTFLKQCNPSPIRKRIHFKLSHLNALFKSIWFLGILGKERVLYWKLVFWTLIWQPRSLAAAITFAINGFHFRKVTEQLAMKYNFEE